MTHADLGLVIVLASSTLGACGQREAAPATIEAPLIQDAAHGGRPGFYFLPPLVPPTYLPPSFEPGLSLVMRFDGPAGPIAAVAMRVDSVAQQYVGVLDLTPFGLDRNTRYRVRIFAGPVELGFGDVVADGQDPGDDPAFVASSKKLKVKVYVNRCATVTCAGATDCRAAATCDPAGGVCHAGATRPNGTPCPDADRCDGDETCKSGVCTDNRAIDCDDGDVCTTDACVSDSGACEHAAIAGCCASVDECDDGDACTTDVCAQNTCSNTPRSGCCIDESDCDDGDRCTTDFCTGEGGTCYTHAVAFCCHDAGMCNDGDLCTVDACVDGFCSFDPSEAPRWDCGNWDDPHLLWGL